MSLHSLWTLQTLVKRPVCLVLVTKKSKSSAEHKTVLLRSKDRNRAEYKVLNVKRGISCNLTFI